MKNIQKKFHSLEKGEIWKISSNTDSKNLTPEKKSKTKS